MSVYVTTYVWHNSKHKGTALLLVLALADQANDEGVCWPSVGTLAHKTRLSERNVQYLLPQVLQSGEVEVIRESHGGHSSRVYRVNVPPPPERPRIARGAKSAPLREPGVPGVQTSASRGAKNDVGVQKTHAGVQFSSPGVKPAAPKPYEPVKEPSLEPDEPSRVRAREDFSLETTDEVVSNRCPSCGLPSLVSDAPGVLVCSNANCKRHSLLRA